VFPVPTAEEAAARAGNHGPEAEYAVSDHPGQPEPGPTNITVVCELCKTRMYVTLDQVGQTIECPDCGTKAVVPPPSEPVTLEHSPQPADTSAEYPVWGVGQPPPEHQEAYQTQIPVICGLCHTRMLATEDQVGQKLKCPDCGTESLVLPMAKRTVPKGPVKPPSDAEATYELCKGPGQPPPGSVAYQTHFPVICPLCHTRLHATLDQVGGKMVCPDCLTTITIPPPPEKLPEIDPMEGAESSYTYSPPIRPPEFQPIFEYAWTKDLDDPETPRPRSESRLVRAKTRPSIGAFFFGIVEFLFYPRVWSRWLVFAAIGGLQGCCAIVAAFFGQIDAPVLQFLTVVFGIGLELLSLGLIFVTSASLVAITVDTAAGNDRVENWPEGPFVDWLFDGLYILNALTVAVLLPAGLAWLVRGQGFDSVLSAAISAYFLFPIVFISMLEQGSVMSPISPPILRSLRSACWAWALFYVETGVFLPSAGVFTVTIALLLGPFGIGVAMSLLVATTIVYFRLLGRLAWVCTQATAQTKDTRQ
jgi:DNA-directed RNA polymerase subunit RPC12/RpoP